MNRNAVHNRVLLKPVAGHAGLAAPGALPGGDDEALWGDVDWTGSGGARPCLSAAHCTTASQFLDWHKPLLRMDENRCDARALGFGFGCKL